MSAPTPPLVFHKGVVVAWDALAGTNTVRILGSDLVNLPVMIGSEVGLVRKGDEVGVFRFHNTYYVAGRIEASGIEASGIEPRALGLVSQRVTAEVPTTSAVFVALSGGPSVEVEIGSSRRCRIELSAHVNSYAGVAYMGFAVSGATTLAASGTRSLGAGGSSPAGLVEVRASSTRVVNLTAADGLVEGRNRFTVVYQFLASNPAGIAKFSDREISVQPF